MDDIPALRLFLAIAETANFARAARRLGLTPAVASRRMAALEAALGQRLFQRSTRRVALTEQGEFLRQHAQHVVDSVDAASEALRGASAAPSGRLRIRSRAGVGRHFLLRYLPEFRITYPDISVGLELVHDSIGELPLEDCDVAITVGHLPDSNFVARRLAETESHLFASPDYLARHGTPRIPRDLERHACLSMSAASGNALWRLSRGGTRHEIPVRAPIAVDDAEALLELACAGQGIILFADWTAQAAVTRGALVRILTDYQVEPRGTPISVLYRSRSYVPLKVRAFLDFYAGKAPQHFASSAA